MGGLLYTLLGLVILNVVFTTFLSVGLIVVLSRGEPEAKRITGEIIEENIRAFRQFLDQDEHREELMAQITKFFTKLSERNTPILVNHLAESVASSIIPGDVFSIAQYLLEYDFTNIAHLLSENLNVASRSFMKIPQYQSGAEVVSIMSSVAGIVADQVEPLSANTSGPTEPLPSLLADLLIRLPVIMEASLNEQSWKQASKDCAILTNRLYFTEFVGTYNTPYGQETFNYNESLKPVFAQINQICEILGASEQISE